jgi:2-polyprenyl-3-methyl-5-hydroxy-6-metoxy-1,4-benzoquinol methylase
MSEYSNHEFTIGAENNSWSHLDEMIPGGSNVLDVGCSTGNFGMYLEQEKKCKVTGIDIDREDIAIAKKNISHAYVMDIDSDSIDKLGSFDVIIFADVIEHLQNPSLTLGRVSKRLLKDNGKICFSIPNMAHLSVRFDLMSGRFPYKSRGLLDKTHLHFYDIDEVNDVFINAGLSINYMKPTLMHYPEEYSKKILQEIGLNPKKKFFEMLEESNAYIFQFVGSAITDTQALNVTRKEYVMPHDQILEYANSLINENEKLWKTGEKYRKKFEKIEAVNNDLRNRLNHKPIKLINKILYKDKD